MEPFNILISSAGRRVALLRIFREALGELGLTGKVQAADASPISGAFHEADIGWQVPPCTMPEFLLAMLDLCHREAIRLLVPTIDTELPIYAEHKATFDSQGTTVLISDPETISIGYDKCKTHRWLVEHGFPTVQQWSALDIINGDGLDRTFPLIVKPRFGSASIGVRRINSIAQLTDLESPEDYVVQTIAPGEEYTIDVLVNRRGRCVCAVPRKRLEVRGGEVSKSLTERRESLVSLGTMLAEALPGAYGVLNIQVFCNHTDGTLNVIEINPRFGGGYPLTWQAGGYYPRWIIEELLGLDSTASCNNWNDGLLMLRYDDAVFVPAALAGL